MRKYLKRKSLTAAVLACLVLLSAGCAFAYQPAPQNTEIKSIPMMVPFRVWVLPGTEGGSMRSGYYKYVQLEMSQPEAEHLKTPGLTPAVMPITPPSGNAAIPTM